MMPWRRYWYTFQLPIPIPIPTPDKMTFLTKRQLRRSNECWRIFLKKPVVKKLVKATGAENYNVLQNNGRIAHQEVDHVHFHMVSAPHFFPLLLPWISGRRKSGSLRLILSRSQNRMQRRECRLVGRSRRRISISLMLYWLILRRRCERLPSLFLL